MEWETKSVVRGTFTALALAAWLLAAPHAARAEGFLDLYFGAAFPASSKVDIHADDPTINNNEFFLAAYPPGQDFDWETSPSIGMRGGYWLDRPPFNFIGFGMDLSYYRLFEQDSFGRVGIWSTPITPTLMLRIPIAYSERFPGGRVQPYVTVGPAFTLTSAHVDLSDLGIGLDDFNDTTFDVGLDARVGIRFPLSRHFALFTEYGYSYSKPHFHDHVGDFFGAPDFEASINLKPTVQVHRMNFGVSFLF